MHLVTMFVLLGVSGISKTSNDECTGSSCQQTKSNRRLHYEVTILGQKLLNCLNNFPLDTTRSLKVNTPAPMLDQQPEGARLKTLVRTLWGDLKTCIWLRKREEMRQRGHFFPPYPRFRHVNDTNNNNNDNDDADGDKKSARFRSSRPLRKLSNRIGRKPSLLSDDGHGSGRVGGTRWKITRNDIMTSDSDRGSRADTIDRKRTSDKRKVDKKLLLKLMKPRIHHGKLTIRHAWPRTGDSKHAEEPKMAGRLIEEGNPGEVNEGHSFRHDEPSRGEIMELETAMDDVTGLDG